MKVAQARDELKRSLEYLEQFNYAASGDRESSCGCFDDLDYDKRKEQTKHISIYLNTWILPGLRRALKELENGQ
jgi:hypothetical protein